MLVEKDFKIKAHGAEAAVTAVAAARSDLQAAGPRSAVLPRKQGRSSRLIKPAPSQRPLLTPATASGIASLEHMPH